MNRNEKLALDGGQPSVPKHLMAHDWDRFRKCTEEEIEAVVGVLQSGTPEHRGGIRHAERGGSGERIRGLRGS